MDILYLCDRKACGDRCSYPHCKHTMNIEHAVNFEKHGPGHKGEIFYEEKDREKGEHK